MDTIGVYPLFTKNAIKEAKEKMHPRHAKGMWYGPGSFGKCSYSIELDAATAIYTATKK